MGGKCAMALTTVQCTIKLNVESVHSGDVSAAIAEAAIP